MTEEDTFNALSRPGFDEMMEIYQSWWFLTRFYNKDKSQRIPFMEKYKWTWYEFIMEAKKRGVGYTI